MMEGEPSVPPVALVFSVCQPGEQPLGQEWCPPDPARHEIARPPKAANRDDSQLGPACVEGLPVTPEKNPTQGLIR